MDHALQNPSHPHPPMAAETQHVNLAQGSNIPQGDNAERAGGSKGKRRLFGLFGFRGCTEPEASTSAAQGGGGEVPENQNIQMVPIIKVTPAEQSETVQPAPTASVPQAAYVRHHRRPKPRTYHLRFQAGPEQSDHQPRGHGPSQGQQPQGQQQTQFLSPTGGTQAGPEGSVISEYSSRGGATGNCLTEPFGCCAYWCRKVCCDGDD
ncbi:hypothetical protein F4811DRAFT_509498 [Daldinia bambusicola]|nr:hypothetical protein F4811DRAFT_509498 [Daldinia bambusicola]